MLLAPLVDLALIRTWREAGWRGTLAAIPLGLAVYVRLLLDRNAPVVGKIALAVAVVYGVISEDLVPDTSFPFGAFDDMLVVVLASRGFMLLCPDRLV
ncbi:MAG: hypothetical protein ACRDL7_01400, partial [Gaiellaceae bacterium]